MGFHRGRPLLRAVEERGLELDQRLQAALAMAGDELLVDSKVFLALCRLNSVVVRYLRIDESRLLSHPTLTPGAKPVAVEDVVVQDLVGGRVLEAALRLAVPHRTLGVRHWLRAVLELGVAEGDRYGHRPFTVDLLAASLTGQSTAPLGELPLVREALKRLQLDLDRPDDFQYVLLPEGKTLAFRVASALDDYVQARASGVLAPCRAVLVHGRDHLPVFTADEIGELEALINSVTATEHDFQRFFEAHPHFLRRWDHREVYPHVCLARPEGTLLPDFVLTDRQLQRAAVVELKLPRAKVVRRQSNRDRFAAGVMEARAQLLAYRDWFRDSANRRSLKTAVGMEIYEPQLVVVIGAAREFRDEFERQRLSADNPDIEIATYDDILTFARRRMAMMATQMTGRRRQP